MRSRAVGASDPDDGIERVERIRHVAGIGRDTVLAPAENRVHAVESFARAATAARLAFIARHRGVVEILAARALQEIAAVRGHVAELPRGAGHDRLREQRIIAANQRMIGRVGVRRQRADRDAAARRLDLGELQAREVDQLVRPLHVLLHQVEDVGPAGEELRLRIRRDSAGSCVWLAGGYQQGASCHGKARSESAAIRH